MKSLGPFLGAVLSCLLVATPSYADCEGDCGASGREVAKMRPEVAGEVDPEMRYAGGWMFAVGLPVSLIAGVTALESTGEGPLANKPIARVGSIAGTVLFGAGTVAWIAGLTMWFIGRQPVAMVPSLSLGPSGAFVGVSGSTTLFGG